MCATFWWEKIYLFSSCCNIKDRTTGDGSIAKSSAGENSFVLFPFEWKAYPIMRSITLGSISWESSLTKQNSVTSSTKNAKYLRSSLGACGTLTSNLKESWQSLRQSFSKWDYSHWVIWNFSYRQIIKFTKNMRRKLQSLKIQVNHDPQTYNFKSLADLNKNFQTKTNILGLSSCKGLSQNVNKNTLVNETGGFAELQHHSTGPFTKSYSH